MLPIFWQYTSECTGLPSFSYDIQEVATDPHDLLPTYWQFSADGPSCHLFFLFRDRKKLPLIPPFTLLEKIWRILLHEYVTDCAAIKLYVTKSLVK